MFPDDYGCFEIVSEKRGDGVNRASAHLKYRENHICCPCCQSNDFSLYDTKAPRKVLDVRHSGSSLELTFDNNRYVCKKCKKRFSANRYPTCIPEKARVTTSFKEAIADYAVDYPGMTLKQIAKSYGVSPTVVSEAVHQRIEATEVKGISTLKPTKLLFVYPFSYAGRTRYAVCGTDTGDKKYLYDIRSDYSASDVETYFKKIMFQRMETPWTTFTGFEEDIIVVLLEAESLKNDDAELSRIGIIKSIYEKRVNDYCEAIRKKERATVYDAVGVGIDNILDIVENADSETTEDNFQTLVKEWYEFSSRPKDAKRLQTAFKPLFDLLDYNFMCCSVIYAYKPEELDIDGELGFIKVFRKNNTPFEEMRLRVMMHLENREGITAANLLTRRFEGFGAHDVFIDLKKLNSVYKMDWKPEQDGEKDDYPEFIFS